MTSTPRGAVCIHDNTPPAAAENRVNPQGPAPSAPTLLRNLHPQTWRWPLDTGLQTQMGVQGRRQTINLCTGLLGEREAAVGLPARTFSPSLGGPRGSGIKQHPSLCPSLHPSRGEPLPPAATGCDEAQKEETKLRKRAQAGHKQRERKQTDSGAKGQKNHPGGREQDKDDQEGWPRSTTEAQL